MPELVAVVAPLKIELTGLVYTINNPDNKWRGWNIRHRIYSGSETWLTISIFEDSSIVHHAHVKLTDTDCRFFVEQEKEQIVLTEYRIKK